jgi:hypothetical protein
MGFINITNENNYLYFDFGDYSDTLNIYNVLLRKESIINVTKKENWIEYLIQDTESVFLIHFEANEFNALIIETIDGNAIVSLDDLFTKIRTLLNT